MPRYVLTGPLLVLIALTLGCGGSSSSSSGNTGTGGQAIAVQHVIVIVFENENYSDVIGSSVMPFFNSVAQSHSLATQFYANTHPSIGNYFLMTTGQNPTGDDDSWAGTFSGDTIAKALTASGKTWKVYAESLPSAGYIGGDQYPYIKHHNPFAYFMDVINSPTQANNIVAFSQFASETNSLPNYSFVVPNNLHNGHDCPNGGATCPISDRLAAIDSWLQSNLSSFLQNSALMSNTLVLITFDESSNDNTNGGGRIPLIVAGGNFKTGYQSTTMYQFPSLLRFSLETLGVTSFPGASGSAPAMNEFAK